MKRTLAFIAGIVGIAVGILIIIGAFMEENFPKALWITAAICEFFNAILFFNIALANRKNR